MRTSSITASGSCGAGRTITVLPIASAGPILPAMLTIGKLYGVMHATTPTGARRASAPMRPAGAIGVAGISCGASGMTFGSSAPRAYRSKRLAATGTCIARPTAVVHPVSEITSGHEVLELLAHADRGRRQELGALLGRRLRPGLERVARRPGRVVRLLHGRLGRDADDLLGRRVHDLVAAVAAVDPLAADEEPLVAGPSSRSCRSPRYDPQGRTCSHFVSSGGDPMDLGRVGIWTFALDLQPVARAPRAGGRARGAGIRRHLGARRRRARPARARRAPSRRHAAHRRRHRHRPDLRAATRCR